jgi:hypothetical protein
MSRRTTPRQPGERKASRRLALKIAARSSMQSIGRSVLIASMVALPVAGLAAIATVYDSTNPTLDERLVTTLGASQAQILVVGPPSDALVQDPQSLNHDYTSDIPASGELTTPAEVLPSGTRIITLGSAVATATTKSGNATFDVLEGEAWDPSLAGRFDVVSGRGPTNSRELMVTASLLPRLGATVGDVVEFQAPAPAQMTIVGILDDQTRPDSDELIFTRNGAISTPTSQEPWDVYYAIPDLVLTWDDVRELNTQGMVAISRDVLLNGPPAVNVQGSYDNGFALVALVLVVGAFAAFEVILLAGAAFTVTARQQQRSLATIASVGAPRRLLFRILAANGVVLGAIGGIIGCFVGLVGALVFMVASGDGSSTQYYGFHVPWLGLLGCVGFAVLIGWISSLAPARNASRFDIVAALRGARKPPSPKKRTPVVGVVMIISGVALTLVGGILLTVLIDAGRGTAGGHPLLPLPIVMMIVGPILAQLGLMLCGPLLLRGIARVLGRRGIGARLASRDAARNPSRAVPALAAVMTTVFVAVVAMCLISAGEENSRREHQYTAQLGQVSVDLRYADIDEDGRLTLGAYPNSSAVLNAVRTALDTDDARILQNVSDPQEPSVDENGNYVDDGTEVAVPVVPLANLCPESPRSPEYTQAIANGDPAAYDKLYTDERCMQRYLNTTGTTLGHLWVGDADDLEAVLGRKPSAEAIAQLADGGAVSLYDQYVHDKSITISWWKALDAAEQTYSAEIVPPLRSVTLDAVVDKPTHSVDYGIFVSRATADALELDYSDAQVIAPMSAVPDQDVTDALNSALTSLPGNPQGRIYATIEAGPPQYATALAWALLALSTLISIAASAVAIGLARFDGRADDATLASLGASPRVRRNFAFWQALIIAGFGTLVGTVIALVPSFAISANPHMPFVPPWLQIGITVIALPLIIAVGSWILTRTPRVTARRMTFA